MKKKVFFAVSGVAAVAGVLIGAVYFLNARTVISAEAATAPMAGKPSANPIPLSVETPAFKAWLSPQKDLNSIFYTVQSGDTLNSIAKKNGVTADLLRIINGVSDKKLSVGKKIKIPTYKLSLVIDKSQNRMILKGNEDVLKTYTVSTGSNNSTPVGTFKINSKLTDPVWYKAPGVVVAAGSPENGLGTRWMGITKKSYGIHGTNEPEKLGQQCTAGCVRMKNEEAEELYRLVPMGAEVTIVD